MDSGAHKLSRHEVAASSETSIQIKIKTMDSQTYSLRVDKQMPVPALKEQIASVTGVVTEHQRLICRGKVLKDDQLLSAYHVEDGHTLHLVVREPAASSSEGLAADPALDQSLSGSRGQFYQVAPGVVVETFNMPGQGDRMLPDINRILSAVLGSIGISNPGNGGEEAGVRDQGADRAAGIPVMSNIADAFQTQPDQSATGGQNERPRMHNAFGMPAAVSFGSQQAPVIPDALTTLSQYLNHMSQEFTNNYGRGSETNNGSFASHGNESRPNLSARSESAQGLPSPSTLAELLSSTRQMLNHRTEECLLLLARELENQANVTDPGVRANAQSSALRTGVRLQNMGAYFLELGRAVTTLRLGRSPSEAVVNAGPAVFISSSGPNPLMVQPLPFQPGASFSTPVSGGMQSGAGLINGLGTGFVPRRIDIQIRRGSSTHQTNPAGSLQSLNQQSSATNVSSETPAEQHTARATDAPSSNGGAAVRVLPFRTMMASLPDLNRLPSESSGGSLGLYYPVLGGYSNLASANLNSRSGSHMSPDHNSSSSTQTATHSSSEAVAYQQNVENPAGNGQIPAFNTGQREAVTSRSFDINILSSDGAQSDQNPEGQVPAGILQLLRGFFPGGELHVGNVSSQGTALGTFTEQERTSNASVEESETRATEDGIFLSRMLQHIMPFISQDADTEQNVSCPGGDTVQHKDGATSSIPAEDSDVGTSRRRGDSNYSPNPKRQKME